MIKSVLVLVLKCMYYKLIAASHGALYRKSTVEEFAKKLVYYLRRKYLQNKSACRDPKVVKEEVINRIEEIENGYTAKLSAI